MGRRLARRSGQAVSHRDPIGHVGRVCFPGPAIATGDVGRVFCPTLTLAGAAPPPIAGGSMPTESHTPPR